MAPPGNGIFVVRGEMSTLMTGMRRGARWSSNQDEEQDGLTKQFIELKSILIQIEDLRVVDPNVFLGPFLDVIRSEETTGPITSLALSAVNKFLSYGLIDPTHSSLPSTVENIADAVTHARFVGTDQASDGVVLMKIVQVLRTLMLSPEGSALTNESVCEIMLSCFRICFEPRLNELLRRTAEHALKDIVLLLFMRLPQFTEERLSSGTIRKLKMIAGSIEQQQQHQQQQQQHRKKKIKVHGGKVTVGNTTKPNIPRINTIKAEEIKENNNNNNSVEPTTPTTSSIESGTLKPSVLATTPLTPSGNIVDMQGKIMQTPVISTTNAILDENRIDSKADTIECTTNDRIPTNKMDSTPRIVNDDERLPLVKHQDSIDNDADVEDDDGGGGGGGGAGGVPICTDIIVKDEDTKSIEGENKNEDFVNSMGVRFIPSEDIDSTSIPLIPYGLPCIREVVRFLITLCNPLDKQNTDTMIHMGLTLLTVALEVGADSVGKYETLLKLVQDDMCKNLFSLLNTERLTIFAADLQLCFLLFESLRANLKFHLEFYLTKLSEIIASENPRTQYEMKELSLDNLLQFWRLPGFAPELYINYDCNLYCTNLFEDLIKLMSKNALSATQQIYSSHQLSLDALLTIVEAIEKNCVASKASSDGTVGKVLIGRHHSRNNSNTDTILIHHSASSPTNQLNDDDDDDLTTTATSGGESSGVENNSFISIKRFENINKNGSTIGGGMPPAAISVMPVANHCLTHQQILEIKSKKRILTQGTELFNQRPDKGILYLQENGILNAKLDPMEIAHFLRENSGLDKKMIGEYISKKKNVESKILETFVKSFDFKNIQIDVALRQYLETFRLPGEAPLIFLVMEHFADHWHKCNGEPFANTDAAFRLAYAIIMLNMDQHNFNAKRLNIPMTSDDFLKNLRGLNGNLDFDPEMLKNVYTAIKNEEIIMPAEQTGIVRENYLWKVLLRRGTTKDGVFKHIDSFAYDCDLFKIVWGPTLAALSFIFDKCTDTTYQKSLFGFGKGAAIAAHYNFHEEMDALVLTLCKFTSLLNVSGGELNEITTTVNFGMNVRGQLAMKSVFTMIHEYGDCVRDSWKIILDLIVQLFKIKLLPKSTFMEVEDFCEPTGRATLIWEKPMQKTDAVGLFSSLYSYLSSDQTRQPTYEEQEIIKQSKRCIKECQIDQIIVESKFLQFESLQELIKCFLVQLKPPASHKSLGLPYAEDVCVFQMELFIKMLIQNRDRMLPLWTDCRDQLYLLLHGAATCGYNYLLIRTTIAILKLAIYLMRNEELCPVILQSLKMLLMLKPNVILFISKQISIGMFELLKTSAQNIHTETDWNVIFTILECVGAGALPPECDDFPLQIGTRSEGAVSSEEDSGVGDRGYISDSEICIKSEPSSKPGTPHQISQNGAGGGGGGGAGGSGGENWILVNQDTDFSMSRPTSPPMILQQQQQQQQQNQLLNTTVVVAASAVATPSTSAPPPPPPPSTSPSLSILIYSCKLVGHTTFALVKCWDSVAFIVRNVAHITPYNFECCVKCIRTFVEASISIANGKEESSILSRKLSQNTKQQMASRRKNITTKQKTKNNNNNNKDDQQQQQQQQQQQKHQPQQQQQQQQKYQHQPNSEDSEDEQLLQRYETIAIQILDLMHTLHIRTAQIFRWWAEEGGAVPQCSALWAQGWCPLLQGIARLATDQRREVRTSAVTCLQRALLVHDLQTLTGPEWASCFKQVLFPLLHELLTETPNQIEANLLEESRMRTATIMAKVFLHHLTPLISLATFNELWLEILDYLESFMKVGSDMLNEAMRESLKNMLLVMHSVRVFHNPDGVTHSLLWDLTWKRIDEFLPHLKEELFKDELMAIQNTTKKPIESQEPQQQQQQHSQSIQSNEMVSNNQQQQQQQNIPSLIPSKTSIILQPPVNSQQATSSQSLLLNQSPSSSSSIPILLPQFQTSIGQQQQKDTINSIQHHQQMIPSNVEFQAMQQLQQHEHDNQIYQQQQQQQPPIIEQSQNDDIDDICIISPEQSPINRRQQQQQQQHSLIPSSNTNDDDDDNDNLKHSQLSSQNIPSTLHSYEQQMKLYNQQDNDLIIITKNESELPPSSSSSSSITHHPSLPLPPPPPPPRIPISHLVATNQVYPSLTKVPINIAQSYAPIFIQPQNQQTGGDIYNDYVNNPYNLTLQPEEQFLNLQQPQQQQQQQQHQQQQSMNETIANNDADQLAATNPSKLSNVFQSSNYFGNDSSDVIIPPGSEMLFTRP